MEGLMTGKFHLYTRKVCAEAGAGGSVSVPLPVKETHRETAALEHHSTCASQYQQAERGKLGKGQDCALRT